MIDPNIKFLVMCEINLLSMLNLEFIIKVSKPKSKSKI